MCVVAVCVLERKNATRRAANWTHVRPAASAALTAGFCIGKNFERVVPIEGATELFPGARRAE